MGGHPCLFSNCPLAVNTPSRSPLTSPLPPLFFCGVQKRCSTPVFPCKSGFFLKKEEETGGLPVIPFGPPVGANSGLKNLFLTMNSVDAETPLTR